MSWSTALADVLEEGILLSGRGAKNSVFDLCEKNESVNMTVTVAGVGESSAVVDMNSVDHPVEHLECVAPGKWRQKCDYLIFTTTDTGPCVILVELKARLRKSEKAFDQLMKTRPIVEYFVSMGQAAGGPVGPITLRYVVFGQKFNARFDIQRVKNRPGEPVWVKQYREVRISGFRDLRISLADLFRPWTVADVRKARAIRPGSAAGGVR